MLTYNDQLTHEAYNNQICNELLNVSTQHQAMNAARFGTARRKKLKRFSQEEALSTRLLRTAYAVAIALVSLYLTSRVAIAAISYLSSGGGGLSSFLQYF